MIKKSYSDLERPAVRREQRKLLPYTVSDIKDIDAWRAARKAKNAEDERNREARFASVVANLQAHMDAGTMTDKLKESSEESEGFLIGEGKKKVNLYADKPSASVNLYVDTAPWYSRLYTKVINWFTNIQFN